MTTVEELRTLPQFHQATITENHLDVMGHMNVRWYVAIFDDAVWNFFAALGLSVDYFREQDAGMFALQQHVRYLAEVRLGETVTIHSRLVERNAKRIHFQQYMINVDTDTLAASGENVGMHMNLAVRRSAPFPDHIAERLDTYLAQYDHIAPPHPLLLKP